MLINRLMEQRELRGVLHSYLVVTLDGRHLTKVVLGHRFDNARESAILRALESHDRTLAQSIRNFQFRDIRPKAASEIDDLGDASRLLGHSDKRITERVYCRVEKIVKPTR